MPCGGALCISPEKIPESAFLSSEYATIPGNCRFFRNAKRGGKPKTLILAFSLVNRFSLCLTIHVAGIYGANPFPPMPYSMADAVAFATLAVQIALLMRVRKIRKSS